jgi:phage tail-like protein
MALPINLLLGAAQRATGLHLDPFTTFNFLLEVEGLLVGGFTAISGLGSKAEVRTVREGGVNDREYKLPGQITYSDIVLDSGLTALDPMWLWYQSTLDGRIRRRNGSVYMLDQRGIPITWWNFYNAWPSEWEGPAFDSSQGLVAAQRFVLSHERVTRSVAALAVAATTLVPR